MRIAMWSGPRNISTAMMRAWGNRPDTTVCDEPFYAHYLEATGLDHPGRDEIIAYHETDWRVVVESLTGPVPEGRAIFYQKHMAHHLLPGMDRGWLADVRNCFLIREPREMITSLVKRLPDPTIEQTGLPQQVEIFGIVQRATGGTPPVLDTKDVLDDPPRLLRALCKALGVGFTDAMLSWPPGPRATDGVWAKHWYDAVEQTTRFQPYRPKDDVVPPHLTALYDECMTFYDTLAAVRLGQ